MCLRALCDRLQRPSTVSIRGNVSANNTHQNGDATTYLVNCPQTVAAAACGIPGNGMTAVAAPTSMQLINVDSNSK